MRDHALSLACLREGRSVEQARGYDDLSAETLSGLAETHVGELKPGALRAALAGCVDALLREGIEAHLPHASVVAERVSLSFAEPASIQT